MNKFSVKKPVNPFTSWRMPSIAIVVLFGLFVSVDSFAADESAVGPIRNSQSNQMQPGKVVWVDLVTTDIEIASGFY